MVRTAFYLSIGLFSVSILSHVVFAQDVDPLVVRLGLKTSETSTKCQIPTLPRLISFSSANHYSQCARFFNSPTPERFNFSQKHQALSLQHTRDISSLVHYGGNHLFHATSAIPLASKLLSAGIEVTYRDPFLSFSSTPSSSTQLGTHVVLRGVMKKMRYRAEYGYAPPSTGNVFHLGPQDRGKGKLLWEWQLPFFTPKVELSRFTNNEEHNSNRNQSLSTRQQYSFDWTIPDWPSLTITYSREQKDFSSREKGSRSNATLMKKVKKKIAFEGSAWKGEWSSGYSTFQNDLHDRGTLEKLHSTLKGTFQFFKPVDISPRIGFTQKTNGKLGISQERHFANMGILFRLSKEQTIQPGIEWSRIRSRSHTSLSDTFFSRLQYSYDPSDYGYQISFVGQYIFNKTSREVSNFQTYDLSLFVRKDIHDLLNLPQQRQFISLKLTHNQQTNPLFSPTQPSGSAAMLLLSIMPNA